MVQGKESMAFMVMPQAGLAVVRDVKPSTTIASTEHFWVCTLVYRA